MDLGDLLFQVEELLEEKYRKAFYLIQIPTINTQILREKEVLSQFCLPILWI